MNIHFLLLRLVAFSLTIASLHAVAQSNSQVLKITFPESRAVFQRENDNTGTFYLSGTIYQPVDSVQARVQAEVAGQGTNTDWITIQRNPQGGVFQGSLRVKGGWYRLEVQGFSSGKVIGSDVVRKIGIGEVFIITGQSNAQGFQDFGAVGAADDRVNCVTYNNITSNSTADPPAPTFEQLSATSFIGPRGQSAWCWGVLGDKITQQFNVPVLFINTAWQGTVIKNWRESADGKIAKNIFAMGTPNENFPVGMPYANLVISLRYYCSILGLRAVLWQQGENDNVPLHSTREAYREDMQYLVNKTRTDTERYPAWVLARSSYNAGQVSEAILQAQNDVISTYNNNVFAGPLTDNIQRPRYEGDVHFGGDGLKLLGQAWFESLNSIFFASSRPLPPLPQPAISVTCAANGSLTLNLPTLYSSYSWNSGQTSRTITVSQPGLYRAVLKDRIGNTYLSPAIDIQGNTLPSTPTISLASQPGQVASNQQQICSDSSVALTINTLANSTGVWSYSGTTTIAKTINLSKAGTYSLQAMNVYGCKSAQTTLINLTVQPKVPTPTIEQVGVYTIKAILPTPSGGQSDAFDWRRISERNTEQLPSTSSEIKVVVSASYSARAKTTFAIANGANITCYSPYSAPKAFIFDKTAGGLSVYPNPSTDGLVLVETVENLKNADIDVFSLTGQRLFSSQIPLLDERKALDLTNLSQGVYLVRVRSAGFDVSKRIIINR
ncbi:hypothetical protein GCM10028807_55960 [Spirosoma daeguense]